MDAGEDTKGTFKMIERGLESASWLGQVPWFLRIHNFVRPLVGNWLNANVRHGALLDLAYKEVAARKDRGSDHQDMLGKLMAVHKEKPEFTEDDMTGMAAANIAAGSDTTAISLRAILWYLLKNPGCKQRLVEEIDDRQRNGQLSDPVLLEEANDMPYLQAVIYEALRLHPAVGMSLPREVPFGGATLGGRFLPAGVRRFCFIAHLPLKPHLSLYG